MVYYNAPTGILYPAHYDGPPWINRFQAPRSRKYYITRALKALMKFGLSKFDTIAFRGVSGALIAPVLADKIGKELLCVRKSGGRDGGDSEVVEGYKKVRKYIIVDDFVESGATARTIVGSIRRFAPNAKCLGVLEVQEITPSDLKRRVFKLRLSPE